MGTSRWCSRLQSAFTSLTNASIICSVTKGGWGVLLAREDWEEEDEEVGRKAGEGRDGETVRESGVALLYSSACVDEQAHR